MSIDLSKKVIYLENAIVKIYMSGIEKNLKKEG